MLCMTGLECVIIFLRREKRIHTLDLKLHFDAGGEAVDHIS